MAVGLGFLYRSGKIMIKKLSTIIGLILALITLIGVIYTYDQSKAKASDLMLTNQRLDQKIMDDRADRVQERIWKLEDRYENKKMEQVIKDEYRLLQEELDKIKGKSKQK